MENKTNQFPEQEHLTDEELEKEMKVYCNILGVYSLLRLVFCAVTVIFGLLGYFGLVSDGIVVAGILGGIAIVVFFHMLYLRKYDEYCKFFLKHRGAEMEEIRTAYFGPSLEEGTSETVKRLQDEIRESELFTDFDKAVMGDYRKGMRNGLVFEAFNVKLIQNIRVEVEGADGEPEDEIQEETFFQGIWIICDVVRELTEAEKHQILLMDAFQSVNTGIAEKNRRLHIAIETEKQFNVLTGDKVDNIEDMRNNLRESMKYVGDIIEELAGHKEFFGQ